MLASTINRRIEAKRISRENPRKTMMKVKYFPSLLSFFSRLPQKYPSSLSRFFFNLKVLPHNRSWKLSLHFRCTKYTVHEHSKLTHFQARNTFINVYVEAAMYSKVKTHIITSFALFLLDLCVCLAIKHWWGDVQNWTYTKNAASTSESN